MKKKKIYKRHHSPFSMIFYKPFLLLFLIFLLPIIMWGIQQKQQLTSSALIRPQADFGNCPTTSSNTFGTIDPIDKYPANDPPPERHPDLNITEIRGYVSTTGEKYPIVLGVAGDPKAPQIWKITSQIPEIVSLYRIYSWDWKTNTKGPLMPLPDDPAASVKQVQMIGLRTIPGEAIRVPDSGYRIGGDYQVMVIFANGNNVTVKYGREDNIGIKFGYAVQIEGVCIDPNLLQLYNQLNSSGRNELPALQGSKILGTASGNEIRVVIRDTGDFLDPRSKLDWWQGVNYPYTPPTNPPTSIPTNPPPPTSPFATPTYVPQPTQPHYPSPTSSGFTSPEPSNPIQPTNYPNYPTATQPYPSLTYYLPPTIDYTQPTIDTNNPQPTTGNVQPTIIIPSPNITPTSAPIIDIGKTIDNARSTVKSTWNNFVNTIINFAQNILP